MSSRTQQMKRARRDIIEAGRRMYQRGYVASNDGNISARVFSRAYLGHTFGRIQRIYDRRDAS